MRIACLSIYGISIINRRARCFRTKKLIVFKDNEKKQEAVKKGIKNVRCWEKRLSILEMQGKCLYGCWKHEKQDPATPC